MERWKIREKYTVMSCMPIILFKNLNNEDIQEFKMKISLYSETLESSRV